MGGGDWNDGMDRLGDEGRGESVWLAWFQIAIVHIFSPLARQVGHSGDADRWQAHAGALSDALENNAWDGNWYLRAFDDEGAPWGSSENAECRIDLIAQAWSVLSGLPVTDRMRTSLKSVSKELVDPEARIVRLLKPPFDKTDRDPGYIRAYPPGIRENGGQYTHAAVWLGTAHAKIKDGDLAYRIFDMINPIPRTASKTAADHYRREPYVLAGDISGVGDQCGRGGWSWYSGAAGWAWQLGVLDILGVRPQAGQLRLEPCLPSSWGGAEIKLQSALGRIEIEIKDPDRIGHGQMRIDVDDRSNNEATVNYPGAGKIRRVVLVLEAQRPETEIEDGTILPD